jgi:predicted transcriptional regulator
MPTVKTAISIDAALFEETVHAAHEENRPRSWVFSEAIREYLARRRDRKLTEQLNAAYADGPDPEDAAFLRAASAHLAELLEDDPW